MADQISKAFWKGSYPVLAIITKKTVIIMYYIWDFLEEKLAIWMKTLALFIPQDPVYYTKMLSRVWLCNLMDCTPPDSSVHGISQARVLEWAAISFSRESFWTRDWTYISYMGRLILYYWTRNVTGKLIDRTTPNWS